MRAEKAVLFGRVLDTLRADVDKASRGDGYLSAREAQKAGSALLRDAYLAARDRNPNHWVRDYQAANGALDIVKLNMALVDGKQGRFISQRDVRRLAALHPEAGARCAKAYEVLTGKVIELARNPRVTLPPDAKEAVAGALKEAFGRSPRDLQVHSVTPTHDGFSIEVTSRDFEGSLFVAKPFDAWVVARTPYRRRDIGTIDAAAGEFFTATFLPALIHEHNPKVVAQMAETFIVARELLPGEADPENRIADHPRVFVIKNGTGSDHGIYASYDPETRKAGIYAFN